jgi:hypothetical protein
MDLPSKASPQLYLGGRRGTGPLLWGGGLLLPDITLKDHGGGRGGSGGLAGLGLGFGHRLPPLRLGPLGLLPSPPTPLGGIRATRLELAVDIEATVGREDSPVGALPRLADSPGLLGKALV